MRKDEWIRERGHRKKREERREREQEKSSVVDRGQTRDKGARSSLLSFLSLCRPSLSSLFSLFSVPLRSRTAKKTELAAMRAAAARAWAQNGGWMRWEEVGLDCCLLIYLFLVCLCCCLFLGHLSLLLQHLKK